MLLGRLKQVNTYINNKFAKLLAIKIVTIEIYNAYLNSWFIIISI
jgi:hypothetical protein